MATALLRGEAGSRITVRGVGESMGGSFFFNLGVSTASTEVALKSLRFRQLRQLRQELLGASMAECPA